MIKVFDSIDEALEYLRNLLEENKRRLQDVGKNVFEIEEELKKEFIKQKLIGERYKPKESVIIRKEPLLVVHHTASALSNDLDAIAAKIYSEKILHLEEVIMTLENLKEKFEDFGVFIYEEGGSVKTLQIIPKKLIKGRKQL